MKIIYTFKNYYRNSTKLKYTFNNYYWNSTKLKYTFKNYYWNSTKLKYLVMLFLLCIICPVFAQAKYVGVINYVDGDFVRIRNGRSVPLSRGIVLYTDCIIDYAPESSLAFGKIQIVTVDGTIEPISSFPKKFKETKDKVLSRDALAELQNFIGGNIVLSIREEETIFEWYCNLKMLDSIFASNLKIIISEKESSVTTDSVSPIVFQLKPDISIKKIECSVSKVSGTDNSSVKVKWEEKKNEWILDGKKLPMEDDVLYVLKTTFILKNGEKEQKEFHYQVFSENKIKEIENEALADLPEDATKFTKNVEIMKIYEEYGLLLPAINMRKEKGLIIRGLLEEIWYEEVE